jgi:hypothetical protein
MMTQHDTPDGHDDFEAELRAMLRRRAAEVQPNPPQWDELIHRAGQDRGVVISLRTGSRLHQQELHRPRRRSWLRPALAAAACLAVTMAAGIAIGRSGDGANPTDDGSVAGEGPTETDDDLGDSGIVAPHQPGFDVQTALPVFPLTGSVLPKQADPTLLALDYLASRGLSEPSMPNGLFFRTDQEPKDPTLSDEMNEAEVPLEGDWANHAAARLWWSVRDDPDFSVPVSVSGVAIGGVEMRNETFGTDEPARWSVVGAFTQGVNLSSEPPQPDGSITVAVDDFTQRSDALDGELIVRTSGVDEPDPGPRALSGQATLDIPASTEPTILELQHTIRGQPVSITSVVIEPTADASASTTVPASPPRETGDQPDVQEVVSGFGADCPAAEDLGFAMELPADISPEPLPGDGQAGDGPTAPCVVHFVDAQGATRVVVSLGWTGAERMVDTEEMGCFMWGGIHEGLMATWQGSEDVYIVDYGSTPAEFEDMLTSTELIVSEERVTTC